MTFSKRELADLKSTIDDSLVKQFGSTDNKLTDSALEYLDRGYDRRKMKKKFMKMMSESDAERFAFRLDSIILDFNTRSKEDKRTSYKRKESNGRSSPKEIKKVRQEEPLKEVVPPKEKVNKIAADTIKEMMMNAQKMIQKRKHEMNIPVNEDDYMSESMLQAQKATELQMNIQRQLASAGLPLKARKLNDDAERPLPLILDDKGRTVDSTGQEVEIKSYQPTLKANIRAMRRDQYKAATERQIEEISDTQYFDGRVNLKPSMRMKRSFKFHTQGKFEQLANRLRTKAQLERLQNEIASVAKKTGIASATRLAISLPRRPDGDYDIPDIEWWDSVIVDPDTFNDDITYSEDNIQGITNLVEHPIQLRPPTEPLVPREMPVMLTKQERKKMRRQNRSENLQEIQEKIRLGLIPAPEAKVDTTWRITTVRVANLMRVLGTEAVQDPTKVEAHVRAQMAKRISEHEKTNQDRKLTKEQRSDKRSRKLMEDTSLGVCVTIFRIVDLSSASIKFKVEANCKQLHMTGIVILHRDCNIVIVEGGPKQQIKFKRLMMKRIKWEDKNLLKEEGGLDADHLGPNNCIIVWEGSVQRRSFGDIKFKMCPTENMCRETLRRNNVAHYWDLAYRASINEEPIEEDEY